MRQLRQWAFLAGFCAPVFLVASCGGSHSPTAASMTVEASSDRQSAQQLQSLPKKVEVLASDESGAPVAGVRVTFEPCPKCGTVDATVAITDNTGHAATTWTLGVALGEQTLSAHTYGLDAVVVRATATRAPPSAPVAMVITQGGVQTMQQHTRIPSALKVQVVDALGNGVPGVQVSFAPEANAEAFGYSHSSPRFQELGPTVNTDADGHAVWCDRVNCGYLDMAGVHRVTAVVVGLPPASFEITVQPSPYTFDGLYQCDRLERLLPVRQGRGDPSFEDPYYPFRGGGYGAVDPDTGTLQRFGYSVGLESFTDLEGTIVVDAAGNATMSGTFFYRVIRTIVAQGPFECKRV